jgi:hypothetical protein
MTFLYHSDRLCYAVLTHIVLLQTEQYYVRYLQIAMTAEAKHLLSNIEKTYIYIYHFVRLIQAVLTHIPLSQPEQCYLRYVQITMPAKPKHLLSNIEKKT